MSASARTGKTPKIELILNWCFWPPALLELLPLRAQHLRRLRRGARPVGNDAADDEAIEIGTQRGAAIASGERRSDPAGLRRIPRRLMIALGAGGLRQVG